MPGQSHKVGRQIIDAELIGSFEDGLALQRRLADLCRDWLPPALEQALDRCAVADLMVRIDRLEVDAGIVSLDRLDQELPASVARTLEQTLRDELAKNNAPAGAPDSSRILSPRENLEEAFVYFLRTGRLPWSFRLPDGKTLEENLTESWLPEAAPEHNTMSALRQVLKLPLARERLARQFSPAFVSLLQTLPGLDEPTAGPLPPDTIKHPGVQRPTPTFPAAQGKPDSVPDRSPEDPSRRKPGAEPGEEEEGLYVGNAGLVLLHPFLPQFFGALAIARDTDLLQPERALSLLHYLATHQTSAPEYELTLPKVLLGLPLDEPVQAGVGLTRPELDEAEALLQAVVRHWEALRNTSPDGLRGAFLLRPGKLSLRSDGDWLLQVEPQAHDILLNQLPWPLSMVLLPWMCTLLRVEWSSGL